jgi:hypothetical protein
MITEELDRIAMASNLHAESATDSTHCQLPEFDVQMLDVLGGAKGTTGQVMSGATVPLGRKESSPLVVRGKSGRQAVDVKSLDQPVLKRPSKTHGRSGSSGSLELDELLGTESEVSADLGLGTEPIEGLSQRRDGEGGFGAGSLGTITEQLLTFNQYCVVNPAVCATIPPSLHPSGVQSPPGPRPRVPRTSRKQTVGVDAETQLLVRCLDDGALIPICV